jgi:hypothetical protein
MLPEPCAEVAVMMGRQTATEPLFHIFCLEDHVPADHPLRQVNALLDRKRRLNPTLRVG